MAARDDAGGGTSSARRLRGKADAVNMVLATASHQRAQRGQSQWGRDPMPHLMEDIVKENPAADHQHRNGDSGGATGPQSLTNHGAACGVPCATDHPSSICGTDCGYPSAAVHRDNRGDDPACASGPHS